MSGAIDRRIRNAEKAVEKGNPTVIHSWCVYLSESKKPGGLEGKTLTPEFERSIRDCFENWQGQSGASAL